MTRLLISATLLFGLTACAPRDIPTADPRPPITTWLAVDGASMLPTYPNGTLAEITYPVDYDTLTPGQIVVFWAYERGSTQFTIHRLIRKQGDQWVTQGDNPQTNARYDPGFVTRENLYAVATGRHAQFLSAPPAK